MPSLRRSFSSPSVRSSPYPAALPSPPGTARLRVNGRGLKRSSSTATTQRRVLADIEWWRVLDGQSELDASRDEDEVQAGDQAQEVTFSNDSGIYGGEGDEPRTPLVLSLSDADLPIPSHLMMPTTEFAALSIAPRTPSRRNRSGNSSLESTPESAEIRTFQSHAKAAAISPLFDTPTRRSKRSKLIMSRSFSFGGFPVSEAEESAAQFSDLGVSFSLDQNLFH